MQPLHPLISGKIRQSVEAFGRAQNIAPAELEEAKLMLSGAHAQLQNACDNYYGFKLAYTTYQGIEDGWPWAVMVPNP